MQKYDVAVVGGGLGGFAAAALLSNRKKKTIVIERGESLNNALGAFEKDGFSFFPTPNLSYGFERGGVIHDFSAGLGILQHTSVYSPCYQVALPDRRITVYAEQNETLEELRREFPKEINALVMFYRELREEALRNAKNRVLAYLSKHRTAAGFMRKYRFSQELTAFFDIQSLFFFQKPAANLSLATLIALCCTPPLHLHGGFRKFSNQLYSLILQHGGDVRYNERSPTFFFRDNGVIGIQTMHGMIESDTLVLNVMPQQQRSRLFVGLLDEDVIPIGMACDVLFLPEYSHPQEFLALSLNAEKNDDNAPKGMKALSVSFKVHQNMVADKRIVEQLGRLIPFLNDYVVFAEEYKPGNGHTVLPLDITLKPRRSKKDTLLFHRTSKKNVFVLHDAPEAPLRVISAVQQYIGKLT